MAKDLFPSTHPLTPPLTEEEWLCWLRLLRSRRVGVSTFYRLMAEHGDAAEALAALPEVAAAAGVKDYQICAAEVVETEWQNAQRAGAVPIAYGAENYPTLLSEIPDPPPILWCIGNPDWLTKPAIAVVGARNASSLGTRMAKKLAADLGEAGFTIVSGLARGIDTAAHLATLETGTIAVMAGGVDVIYPAENAVLGQEIAEKGLRISESPMSITPQARHFPRRNRIISGLARATIVVEAAAKSGSLITARTALDQGREVLSVPGHPFDARASGCNMLIRDGSTLVRNAQDVLDALARDTPPSETPPVEKRKKPPAIPKDVAALHQEILNRLGPSPVPEDQLIRDLGGSAAEVSPEVATLELQGLVQRAPGGLLTRIDKD